MTGFVQSLLSASLYGSVVIGVILLLRLLLRKAPKKYICLLWLLAAVRLLLPFQIESSLSLQPSGVQDVPSRLEQSVQSQVQTPTAPSSGGEATLPGATPGASAPADTPTAPAPDVTTPVETPVTEKSTDPMAVAGWIWAAVAMGMLLYSAVSYLRLRRRVSDSVILTEGVWVTKLDTAMVLGFFRPQIYLSAGLDETQQDFVLRHEQCHIRRGDHLWKPLGYLTLAIHWFNPLVWLGYILLCRDLEMACDEAVIRHLDLPQRKSYSAALLSCSAHRHAIAACPVAFGEVSVKERIKNVLNYKKPTFWVILVSAIAVAVVAVCFLTTPKTPDPETQVPDDWGITVSAEDATASSVTLHFIQTGALPNQRYWYGHAFSLERWSGDAWEAVPQLTDAVFTTEAMSMNTNGETCISVNWEWLYGQLPDGYYRVSKWIGNDAREDRRFDACFRLGESGETQEPPATAPTLGAQENYMLGLCLDALAQLRSQEAMHITIDMTIAGYPYNTGNATDYYYADGNWLWIFETYTPDKLNDYTVGYLQNGDTQYRFAHAGSYGASRTWGIPSEDLHSEPLWVYAEEILTENIVSITYKYAANGTEVTMYFNGRYLASQTADYDGPVLTWYLDKNGALLRLQCASSFSLTVEGITYHPYSVRELQFLHGEEETVRATLDAAIAEATG